MYPQRPSRGSNSPPIMYLLPQNRTVRSYTDAVAGCQNQASLSNLQSSYRRTPPRQQEPGQRVPDTQSQRTGHLPATRRPTYAEVVRKQKPISSQYNSTHPLGPGSTLAENVQPWGPPRHGPGTANRRDVASDMTTDIMSDQEQMSDEMMFAMYTHGGNSEGAHESSPSNSMTYRRSVLPSSAPTRGRLGNDDDDPWSTVHQRGSQNSMVSPRPHLPVMGPSAFQPNHAGGGTYLAPPDLYHLSHVRNFNHDIHNAIQNAQPTRPNRVYGQTDHGTTQNTNHRRASRQVHPNQRVPSSANDRQINNDSVVRVITATRSLKETRMGKEILQDISVISTKKTVVRFFANTVVNCFSGLTPVSNTTGINTQTFTLPIQALKGLDRVAFKSKLAYNMKHIVLEVAASMTLRHCKTTLQAWDNQTNILTTSVDLHISNRSKPLPYKGVFTDVSLHLLPSTNNTLGMVPLLPMATIHHHSTKHKMAP
ncbi:hypothetical protein COCC4DRAFT_57488 [Bipolaris maydis ATCC 48331]|uniref:Uncharacterized protein n=2 Tax=Cochliobolus heterostrophus TaxID=5016 RepID=M2UUF0_COCH5|nr:uncharacterized protein COCC4DRAFT_57488 [Bipolaris maydis ATCC 48331]EMD91483.1 hypothetical protein COCHEDRAFT_1203739 [Bipolaris maydis C5]KAJ5027336.1 hypothetical protein J3E73DRAFT_431295 [Bipolaris maydis]ENI08759.1 hypothetical protein COCC4DRAFT_57488 [Bipolaris maydis ATCC 48331]KAJ6208876.1 hypothetical protein PSV09DRAFT_1203739 [Bipolaris maydis]KAJ6270766.1 hypothetical protein PSV08DRAFT_223434 [Bipolaris maydis]